MLMTAVRQDNRGEMSCCHHLASSPDWAGLLGQIELLLLVLTCKWQRYKFRSVGTDGMCAHVYTSSGRAKAVEFR